MNDSVVQFKLDKTSRKFMKACEQIKMLKQRISELIALLATQEAESTDSDYLQPKNASKELLRKQIEQLQTLKSTYFMYAHKKADEITRLQCELYGEDVVRDAYQNQTNQNYDSIHGN